jgi:hypothetical protein
VELDLVMIKIGFKNSLDSFSLSWEKIWTPISLFEQASPDVIKVCLAPSIRNIVTSSRRTGKLLKQESDCNFSAIN